MKSFITLFAVVALLTSATAVRAGIDIPVANFSFESEAVGTSNYQYGGLTGWTINGSAGPQNFIDTGSYGSGATLPGTAQGVQAAFINGGDIYQDVGKLLANTTYTLTVAAGNQPGYGPGSTGAIGLVNGSTDGGTALGTFTSIAQPALPTSTFADFTFTATTGGSVSGDLTIVLKLSSYQQVDFDNVRLSASSQSTPEPASLAVWGVVIAGGILVARRRKA